MAAYKDIKDYMKALPGILKKNGVVVTNSEAEARQKVTEWQIRVEKALRRTMADDGYMPGSPVFYTRTGQYPQSTQKSTPEVTGSVVYGEVGYTAYSKTGLYGRKGSVDIPTMIEHGYQVRTIANYKTPKGAWRRDFRFIPYFGVRPGVPVRALVVSELAGAAAAEGVRISLK